MNKPYVFFDLDGTLTESGEGIMNSVAYAFEKLGFEIPDRAVLKTFVGPPLVESFSKQCGFDEAESLHAVKLYREYFTSKGMFENSLYDGVVSMLDALKKHGRKLIITTSKPEMYTGIILEHFGIARYFDHICGATADEKRTKKNDVLEYAIACSGLVCPDDGIMVGDRCYDITASKKFGLTSVGVLYGYGDRAELEQAGADYICETAEALSLLLDKI